jgi:hypothetical protein
LKGIWLPAVPAEQPRQELLIFLERLELRPCLEGGAELLLEFGIGGAGRAEILQGGVLVGFGQPLPSFSVPAVEERLRRIEALAASRQRR